MILSGMRTCKEEILNSLILGTVWKESKKKKKKKKVCFYKKCFIQAFQLNYALHFSHKNLKASTQKNTVENRYQIWGSFINFFFSGKRLRHQIVE